MGNLIMFFCSDEMFSMEKGINQSILLKHFRQQREMNVMSFSVLKGSRSASQTKFETYLALMDF
jgi:hypothetical protein